MPHEKLHFQQFCPQGYVSGAREFSVIFAPFWKGVSLKKNAPSRHRRKRAPLFIGVIYGGSLGSGPHHFLSFWPEWREEGRQIPKLDPTTFQNNVTPLLVANTAWILTPTVNLPPFWTNGHFVISQHRMKWDFVYGKIWSPFQLKSACYCAHSMA